METPAHLCLAPSCHRGWGSLYDALNAGTMDVAHLERLVASYRLEDPQTSWFALDASVWPRCDAETSPERGYYPHPYRHSHGQPIVAGWNYSCACSTFPSGHIAPCISPYLWLILSDCLGVDLGPVRRLLGVG